MAFININNTQYELPDVGVLRYLKDPVSTINDLYARYRDGGEFGWFALCADTNRFAVWSIEDKKWVDTGLTSIDIEGYEESIALLKSTDYILAYLPEQNKTVKVKVGKLPSSSGGTTEIPVLDFGAWEDFNVTNLADGQYNVASQTKSGLLFITNKVIDDVKLSVLQVYIDSGDIYVRRITISDPQTYPDWSIKSAQEPTFMSWTSLTKYTLINNSTYIEL